MEGFAPASRAAQQFEEAGIYSRTLQHFLAQRDGNEDGVGRVHFVDESSLPSPKQANEFLCRLGTQERVIPEGDVRQHQGVEAGRPFEQLQEAGMVTARFNHIIRKRDPGLKQAVERLV